MEKRNLICICCPLGCSLTVTLLEGKNSIVEGNTCPKGKSYGEKECINPTRMVTSSVPVLGRQSYGIRENKDGYTQRKDNGMYGRP